MDLSLDPRFCVFGLNQFVFWVFGAHIYGIEGIFNLLLFFNVIWSLLVFSSAYIQISQSSLSLSVSSALRRLLL